MNCQKEQEYLQEIERLKATIGAMTLAQSEVIAWYIYEKDLITQDKEWALENADMCHPLVVALDMLNNEWIPDLCDCDLDAKDNCELCTCGLSGFWQQIDYDAEENDLNEKEIILSEKDKELVSNFVTELQKTKKNNDCEEMKKTFEKIGVEYIERTINESHGYYQYLIIGVREEDKELDFNQMICKYRFFEFCDGELASY